jgi:uncharacterized membrane protein YkgB
MSVPLAASETFDRLDRPIARWMAKHGIFLLRLSVGIVFVWFGALKFMPGLSAADDLATRTIAVLSFGWVPPAVSRIVLAAWETSIGLGLLSGKWLRATLLLLFLQMLGTLTPLLLFAGETWRVPALVPTLEGQYIIKNLVLLSAGLVIGATARGGGLVDDPVRREPG